MNHSAGDVGGHSVAVALTRLSDSLKDISGTPLWSASDTQLTDVLAMVSQLKAQLAAVELQTIAEAHGRDIARRVGAASTQAWLRHKLRLTPAEAKKQTALAIALDRDLDATRRALAEGEISVPHAQAIARAVEDLPCDAETGIAEKAEAQLVGFAQRFDPHQLARLGKRILEVVDPEMADSEEARRLAYEENRAHLRRELVFTDDGHGTVWLRGRLDTESAATVQRALDPLAKPRPSDAGLPDKRTPAARAADALLEACRRVLRRGDLPTQRGETPQIVVTIDYHKLRGQVAAGALDTGERLSPGALRRVACDAQIIPAVLGTDSMPLDLGRAVRLFTPAQRRALILRDKGCAFPGCDRHPQWCEAHHIRHWADGGVSDLDNGVLLCGHHHRLIHKGEWEVQIADDGHPEFIPPSLIDPRRKPLRNHLRNHHHAPSELHHAT
ncbi:MAG: DUF222 domain-containing protein [Micromonosporaceae bacterium]|nr:DUF222 domain-containing protein [Micromonosporaceae bacterium]